jgi:hypothetical protein
LKRRSDLPDTSDSEQSGTVDPEERDVGPAVSSPAQKAEERQEEMEESGEENPA